VHLIVVVVRLPMRRHHMRQRCFGQQYRLCRKKEMNLRGRAVRVVEILAMAVKVGKEQGKDVLDRS
jgi:predicted amidophosphoribosyltransferase